MEEKCREWFSVPWHGKNRVPNGDCSDGQNNENDVVTHPFLRCKNIESDSPSQCLVSQKNVDDRNENDCEPVLKNNTIVDKNFLGQKNLNAYSFQIDS
jgi:hypothetical protein